VRQLCGSFRDLIDEVECRAADVEHVANHVVSEES
jgi:hypothetical protein